MSESLLNSPVLQALVVTGGTVLTAYIVNVVSKKVNNRRVARALHENPRQAEIYDGYERAMSELKDRLVEANELIGKLTQDLTRLQASFESERRTRILLEENIYRAARKYDFDPAEVLIVTM